MKSNTLEIRFIWSKVIPHPTSKIHIENGLLSCYQWISIVSNRWILCLMYTHPRDIWRVYHLQIRIIITMKDALFLVENNQTSSFSVWHREPNWIKLLVSKSHAGSCQREVFTNTGEFINSVSKLDYSNTIFNWVYLSLLSGPVSGTVCSTWKCITVSKIGITI